MGEIHCDNFFCIYQQNSCCRLDRISIDELGICEACIRISLDGTILQEAKDEALKRYHSDL